MSRQKYLGCNQHALLCEALRRFCRFAVLRDGKGVRALTSAWTGLGSASEYSPVYRAGLMVIATTPNPGHMTWWRLTPKGARIVKVWLKAGWTYQDIEANNMPSMEVPQ